MAKKYTHLKPFVPAAVLLAALAVAFAPIAFGRFYAVGDIASVFIPLETFFHAEQIAARLPAWLPAAAWGFPAIASAQLGFFYPPLLLARYLPVPLYLSALVLAHAAGTLAGMYVFTRVLGRSRPAAALASLTFALGGFLIMHLTHLNIFFAAAWLPWQLAAIQKQSAHPQPYPQFIARLSLLLALPFLAGQVQVPLLMVFIASAYWLYLQQRRQQAAAGVVALGVAGLLAVALAAAQLLPTVQLAQYSNRGGGLDTATANQYSYPLYHLPAILFPRFFGNDDTYWGKRLQIEYGFYVGTIPLLLALREIAITLAARRKEKGSSQPDSMFWLWVLIISILLALGSWSPFRLIGLESSLWFFSAPARWLLLTSLACALLAAAGLDNLTAQPRAAARYFRTCLLVIALAIAAGNAALIGLSALPDTAWLAVTPRLEKISSLLDSAAAYSISLRSPYTYIPPLVLTAAWLVFYRSRTAAAPHGNRHLAAYAWPLVILTAAELAWLALTSTPHYSWRSILTPPPTYLQLPADITSGLARIYTVREQGDTGAYFTNPESRPGWHDREQLRRLLPPLLHSQFNILGVEWPASIPLQTHTDLLDTIREPGGYTVSDTQRAAALNIGAILAPTDDAVNVTLLPASPRFELMSADGTAPAAGTITATEIVPPRLAFSITANQDSTLVVRDTHFPGWQAHVDGQPVPIEQTEKIFRRLAIPPGKHEVTLSYQPRALHWGIGISLAALILAGAIFWSSRWKGIR